MSAATGAVTSPMQGTVLSVAVGDGDAVSSRRPDLCRRGDEDGERDRLARRRRRRRARRRGGRAGLERSGHLRDRVSVSTSMRCADAVGARRRADRRDGDPRRALAPDRGSGNMAARRLRGRRSARGCPSSRAGVARAEHGLAPAVRSSSGACSRAALSSRSSSTPASRRARCGVSSCRRRTSSRTSISRRRAKTRAHRSCSSAGMGRGTPAARCVAPPSIRGSRITSATTSSGSRRTRAGIALRRTSSCCPPASSSVASPSRALASIVARALTGRIELVHYRGRVAYPAPVQAAETSDPRGGRTRRAGGPSAPRRRRRQRGAVPRPGRSRAHGHRGATPWSQRPGELRCRPRSRRWSSARASSDRGRHARSR